MMSAARRIKNTATMDAHKEDDLVEFIPKGVDNYGSGRAKNFKSKEELRDHFVCFSSIDRFHVTFRFRRLSIR